MIVELIIIIGVYYDKLYDFKTIVEYEKTVVQTATFKSWYLYNNMIDVMYSASKEVGEKIPTTDDLMELLKISNISVTKPEFDRFIKVLYGLEIVYLDGKRRILNKSEIDGKTLLKQYFKIN